MVYIYNAVYFRGSKFSVKLLFNFLLKPFSTPFLKRYLSTAGGGGGGATYINTAIEISQSLKAHSHEFGFNPD